LPIGNVVDVQTSLGFCFSRESSSFRVWSKREYLEHIVAQIVSNLGLPMASTYGLLLHFEP